MRPGPTGFARLVRAAALLAWLAGYAWLLADERYRAYLSPTLRPLLFAALGLLTLLLLGTLLRRGPAGPSAAGLTLWVRSAVLVLPLLYLAATHGRGLNSHDAARRAMRAGPTSIHPGTPPPRDVPPARGGELTLLEIIRDPARQLGQRVVTEGMVCHGENVPAGHCLLLRFTITCCVADAQPIAVLVAHPRAEALPADRWLRVAGELTLLNVNGEESPCIRADTVTPIDPPRHPYLPAF